MSFEIWPSSAASRIFNAFSSHAKLRHSIADIRIRERFVSIMFNQLRMNSRRPMTIFSEIFDEDSLRDGYGKRRTEDLQELLPSGYFISDEDRPADFQLRLATTRNSYNSIRVEMQIASEICILYTYWTPCIQYGINN
jgi:hypothetical protein